MTLTNDKFNALQEIIFNYVGWLYTRGFYTAPMPKNILARLSEGSKSGEPPNARNSVESVAFNMVMQWAADCEKDDHLCFLYVYMKQYRPEPVKTLAARLGIDSDTVYQRAHKAATRYYGKTLEMVDLNAKIQREVRGHVEVD